MIDIIPNWHPIFVHFTVALLSLSAILFMIQRPFAETAIGDNFLIVARYSLWLGVLISIATVIAGWDAYNTVNHDDLSHAAMTEHRNWGLATFALFAFLGLWWKIVNGINEKASLLFLLCLLIGTGLLGAATYKGSQLVFKFGLGVQSLPAKDDHKAGSNHGHNHAHDKAPASHHDSNTIKDHSHDSISENDHHSGSLKSIEHDHDSENRDEQKAPPLEKEEINVEFNKIEEDVSSANETQSAISIMTKPIIKIPPEIVDEPTIEVVNKPKVENKLKVTDRPKVESTPEVTDKPKMKNKPTVADKPKIISSPETEVENNTEAVDENESAAIDELITDKENTFFIPKDEDNTFLIH